MREMALKEAKVTKIKAIGAGVLLAWSLPSHALTLGKFQVQSAIGEPLRAEVEITQFTPDELRGLQAQLASPASFRQAGMEYNAALIGMVAKIENRHDGRPVIVLSGRNPVQDSFIDLILEAQWSAGRAVKNYAMLLNSASPSSVISRQTNVSTPSPLQQESTPTPRTAPVAAMPVSSNDNTHSSGVNINSNPLPVHSLDTIDKGTTASTSSIATRQKASFKNPGDTITMNPGDTVSHLIIGCVPANVSLDQMLLAMVRANPNSFIEGNVNLVRAGAVLRIPSATEATEVSRTEAHQAITAQHRDFAAYARRVAESALLVGSAKNREMSGHITTETQNTLPPIVKQDKLTLSKAQKGDGGDEAKLAAGREAKDAADQLAALNKNMQDLEALANDRKKPSTSDTPSSAPQPAAESQPLMDQLSQQWAWIVAALLSLLALVFYTRKKNTQSHAVFAPSYDDFPTPSPATEPVVDIPPQMAGIDLDLPSPNPSNEPEEQEKLALASQLLVSGDKEMARTLIMSVVSTASGDLKARAQQMLGQIA
jgi:pilus assembly protein FimV